MLSTFNMLIILLCYVILQAFRYKMLHKLNFLSDLSYSLSQGRFPSVRVKYHVNLLLDFSLKNRTLRGKVKVTHVNVCISVNQRHGWKYN